MTPDIIFQFGSLLGRAISLAMGIVAFAVGVIMLFDASRFYRNREHKAKEGSQDLAAPAMVFKPAADSVSQARVIVLNRIATKPACEFPHPLTK